MDLLIIIEFAGARRIAQLHCIQVYQYAERGSRESEILFAMLLIFHDLPIAAIWPARELMKIL